MNILTITGCVSQNGTAVKPVFILKDGGFKKITSQAMPGDYINWPHKYYRLNRGVWIGSYRPCGTPDGMQLHVYSKGNDFKSYGGREIFCSLLRNEIRALAMSKAPILQILPGVEDLHILEHEQSGNAILFFKKEARYEILKGPINKIAPRIKEIETSLRNYLDGPIREHRQSAPEGLIIPGFTKAGAKYPNKIRYRGLIRSPFVKGTNVDKGFMGVKKQDLFYILLTLIELSDK